MSLLKKPYNALFSSTLPSRASARGPGCSAVREMTPSEEFLQLRPYDIWCLIFKHLNFGDFLQCTGVCSAWYYFIIDWPEFWDHFARVPHVNRLAVDTLVRRQACELCLHGPMDCAVTQYILLFLPCSNNHSMKKLSFKNLSLTMSDTDHLASALRLLSSSVESIEFVDCDIPRDKLISPILESCSHLERVSFSRSEVTPKDYNIKRPDWRSSIPLGISFPSLTYLKLCAEQIDCKWSWFTGPIDTGRLSGILRNCPNLTHLFLDSGGSAHQGHCISQVVKHCPRLKTLVVNDRAEMPVNFTDTNAFAIEQPPTSTVKGISKLVLSGGRIQLESDDVTSAYKSAYKSLDLLYLHYGGGHGAINADVFSKFARWTASCLRVVRISTEASGADACFDQRQSIATALAAFLAKCPALEVIFIEDTFSTGYNPNQGRLDVDDQILKAIAKNCLFLRHLTVIGRRCHTNSGILYFASTVSKTLTYLEIDTYRKNLLTLSKLLNCLETLHVRRDSMFHSDTIEPSDIPAIKHTLQQRGGSIILPANECPEPIRDIYDKGGHNEEDAFTL